MSGILTDQQAMDHLIHAAIPLHIQTAQVTST